MNKVGLRRSASEPNGSTNQKGGEMEMVSQRGIVVVGLVTVGVGVGVARELGTPALSRGQSALWLVNRLSRDRGDQIRQLGESARTLVVDDNSSPEIRAEGDGESEERESCEGYHGGRRN